MLEFNVLRKCNMSFNQIDFTDIIQYISLIPNFHTKLWNDHENKLINILYELSNKINKESYDKNNFLIITYLISSFKQLIEKTPDYSLTNTKSNEFFHKILTNFTAFTTNMGNTNMGNTNMRDANMLILLSFEYNYFKNKSIVNNSDDQITQVINMFLKATLSPELKCLISKTINTLSKLTVDKKNMIGTTDKNILPIIYPFDTKFLITDIVEIQELQSSSCPLLVTVLIQDDKLKLNKIEKKFILKTDSGLRKENIVSSLIIILQNKLIQQMKRGRIDYFEPIPTYKIIMITNNIGIIEFLDNCLTLKNINSKNYTLQNYILDNNKDARIKTIKERFAKSLAISSCLSYVLGLGDRHASNIMISKSGHIIHIDYGYILENPIHSTIVNNPIIRISNEMIDFLGGWNSEYYNLFKNYIIKVFDIIRLYSDIIINYYNILANENIIDWSIFKKRLTDRFLNGMTFKDIEVVLLDVIEASSNGYGGVFIDLCNEYGSKLKIWK
jgi:phosphatidylinositol kinase/protein kinase (PI-3  family)